MAAHVRHELPGRVSTGPKNFVPGWARFGKKQTSCRANGSRVAWTSVPETGLEVVLASSSCPSARWALGAWLLPARLTAGPSNPCRASEAPRAAVLCGGGRRASAFRRYAKVGAFGSHFTTTAKSWGLGGRWFCGSWIRAKSIQRVVLERGLGKMLFR